VPWEGTIICATENFSLPVFYLFLTQLMTHLASKLSALSRRMKDYMAVWWSPCLHQLFRAKADKVAFVTLLHSSSINTISSSKKPQHACLASLRPEIAATVFRLFRVESIQEYHVLYVLNIRVMNESESGKCACLLLSISEKRFLASVSRKAFSTENFRR